MATSIFRENFPAVAALQQAADTAAYIIGLDLHAKTMAVCVVDPAKPQEPVFQRKRLPNAELLSVLSSFTGNKVIACEAAFGWHVLEDALACVSDVTFIPLDARKTSAWIKSSGIKNDRIDAQVLCHVCLHGGIRSLAVHRQNLSSREGMKLVRYREQLVRRRCAVKNQIRSFERDYGPNPFTGEIPEKSIPVSFLGEDLGLALEESDERIGRVEKLMAAMGKDDPVMTILRTIPGIGPITAFALRHKIDDIHRFKDAAHLSSYLGFGVREHQSGEIKVKGKIAKTGDPLLRKLLIQGAQYLRCRRPELVSLYFPALAHPELMRNRKHANKVVTALARKNLTLVWHLWKNRMPFDLEIYRAKRLTASTAGGTIPASPLCPAFAKATAGRPSPVAELVIPLVRQGLGVV
jgi:transposase